MEIKKSHRVYEKACIYFSTSRVMVLCQEICVSRDTRERAQGLSDNITVCEATHKIIYGQAPATAEIC